VLGDDWAPRKVGAGEAVAAPIAVLGERGERDGEHKGKREKAGRKAAHGKVGSGRGVSEGTTNMATAPQTFTRWIAVSPG
jgi:hypothetical protein